VGVGIPDEALSRHCIAEVWLRRPLEVVRLGLLLVKPDERRRIQTHRFAVSRAVANLVGKRLTIRDGQFVGQRGDSAFKAGWSVMRIRIVFSLHGYESGGSAAGSDSARKHTYRTSHRLRVGIKDFF
jgi:hypothetical protein